MSNKIQIPWYYKNVRRVKPLDFDPFDGFEFPDGRKKTPNRPKPDPIPQYVLDPVPQTVPSLQPTPIKEIIYNPDGTEIVIYDDVETPIPLTIPSRIPSPNTKPLPTWDGKTPKEPTIPGRTLRDLIPTITPKPSIVNPNAAIKMPGGEILFKLMEAEPSGKYDNFLSDYNDFTLKLAWNIANPVIVHPTPSYEQVMEFLKQYDIYDENVTRTTIIEYFQKQGVKGKDLTSIPQRIYIYKKAIDTMTIIEDIFVPPIQNPGKQYES